MISATKLSKRFRGKPVLDRLDLRIEPGERVALVGANGAGKTTLIRCLLGEYVYDGTLTVAGSSPRAARRRLLAATGFVPQLPPPLKMPVRSLLRFASGLCDDDPGRMAALAGSLGLDCDAVARQPFTRLSGGQQQKLLIAIALGRDSELLLLDEPAANLDPDARRVFFDLLAARQGTATMLLSSHRLDEIAPLVTRVLELDQGRVVLDEPVVDAVSLASRARCRLALRREEPAVSAALESWGFQRTGNGAWEGQIPGPDRLRFLGLLSRYAALLESVHLDEAEDRPS